MGTEDTLCTHPLQGHPLTGRGSGRVCPSPLLSPHPELFCARGDDWQPEHRSMWKSTEGHEHQPQPWSTLTCKTLSPHCHLSHHLPTPVPTLNRGGGLSLVLCLQALLPRWCCPGPLVLPGCPAGGVRRAVKRSGTQSCQPDLYFPRLTAQSLVLHPISTQGPGWAQVWWTGSVLRAEQSLVTRVPILGRGVSRSCPGGEARTKLPNSASQTTWPITSSHCCPQTAPHTLRSLPGGLHRDWTSTSTAYSSPGPELRLGSISRAFPCLKASGPQGAESLDCG